MTSTDPVGPDPMRSAVGNIGGIIARAARVVVDLEELHLDPGAFAGIGGDLARTAGALRDRQATALRAVLTRLLHTDVLAGRVTAGPLRRRTGADIWPDGVAERLAAHAVADAPRAGGRPNSVRTVLEYLALAGLAGSSAGVPTEDAVDFAAWLDEDAGHQVALGLIGVFRGAVRELAEVPGGVHDGDVVLIEPGPDARTRRTTLGIAASGRLYNNGQLYLDFGSSAWLRLYRPIGGRADD